MKKFTVFIMTPHCSFEDVEASSEEEAIRLASNSIEAEYLNPSEPCQYLAVEEVT